MLCTPTPELAERTMTEAVEQELREKLPKTVVPAWKRIASAFWAHTEEAGEADISSFRGIL